MSKINVVLLDMDGVLVDSRETIYRSFTYALKHTSTRFNLKISAPRRSELIKLFGNHIGVIFSHFLNRDSLVDYATSVYHSNYSRFIHLTKVLPNVFEALKLLKSRFKLGVVTNTPSNLTGKILFDLKLLDFFDIIVGCDEGDEPKPNPSLIYEACRALKCDLNYCVFVGDSIQDADAAKSAGIEFIGVNSWVYSKEELMRHGAIAVFNDLLEVVDLLEEKIRRS